MRDTIFGIGCHRAEDSVPLDLLEIGGKFLLKTGDSMKIAVKAFGRADEELEFREIEQPSPKSAWHVALAVGRGMFDRGAVVVEYEPAA